MAELKKMEEEYQRRRNRLSVMELILKDSGDSEKSESRTNGTEPVQVEDVVKTPENASNHHTYKCRSVFRESEQPETSGASETSLKVKMDERLGETNISVNAACTDDAGISAAPVADAAITAASAADAGGDGVGGDGDGGGSRSMQAAATAACSMQHPQQQHPGSIPDGMLPSGKQHPVRDAPVRDAAAASTSSEYKQHREQSDAQEAEARGSGGEEELLAIKVLEARAAAQTEKARRKAVERKMRACKLELEHLRTPQKQAPVFSEAVCLTCTPQPQKQAPREAVCPIHKSAGESVSSSTSPSPTHEDHVKILPCTSKETLATVTAHASSSTTTFAEPPSHAVTEIATPAQTVTQNPPSPVAGCVDLLATAAEDHGVRWKEARGKENRLPFRDLKSSRESRVSVPNFKNKSSVVVKRIKVMPEKESCHSPIAAHVPPRLARDLRPRVKRKVQDAHAQENENNQNGAKGVKTIHDNLLFLLPERGERMYVYDPHGIRNSVAQANTHAFSLSLSLSDTGSCLRPC
jgi:hypothetical protein